MHVLIQMFLHFLATVPLFAFRVHWVSEAQKSEADYTNMYIGICLCTLYHSTGIKCV